METFLPRRALEWKRDGLDRQHTRPQTAAGSLLLPGGRAAWREKQRLSGEWIKTVPKTDYAAIVECLRALRRGKEVGG